MQQATYEEFQHELTLLFDYNPPPLVPDPQSSSQCPKLRPPPLFYEKHLDDRLKLKRVVLMPSITTRLSEAVDKTLQSIEQQEIQLSSYGPRDCFPTQRFRATSHFDGPIIDADSVARAYRRSTAVHCMTIASMLFLSPRASRWDRALNWISDFTVESEGHRALAENYALELRSIPGTSSISPSAIPEFVWDSMNDKVRMQLLQVAQRFPTIAFWQIFSISTEAKHFLDDMTSTTSLQNFPYDKYQTIWHRAALPHDLPYAPDAISTSWGVPVAALSQIPETSTPPAPLPPPDIDKMVDKKHVKKKMTGRSTSDETWPHVTVVNGSSSTATLTTSLLQHVGYSLLLVVRSFTDCHPYRLGFLQF